MSNFKFIAKKISEGKPVAHSNGMQRVLILLEHQKEYYVVIHDEVENGMYINKLKSIIPIDLYVSENFMKIESDEEYDAVYNIVKNYGILL